MFARRAACGGSVSCRRSSARRDQQV